MTVSDERPDPVVGEVAKQSAERMELLYRCEDFISRVTDWTGSDEDELHDLLREVREALDLLDCSERGHPLAGSACECGKNHL